MKTIGVLGGMGPDATALFFHRLVALTPAKCDQNHIPIIVYNNPQIPDRTKAIMNHGENPLPALMDGVSVLQKAGADFICIPCNTVHYYFSSLKDYADIPIINLINCVLETALEETRNLGVIGLLATKGTIKSGIYQSVFAEWNMEVITPEERELNELQSAIHRLKNKSRDSSIIRKMAVGLVRKGMQGLILGCTELSLIAADLDVKVPLLDSIEILARKAVRVALDQEDI